MRPVARAPGSTGGLSLRYRVAFMLFTSTVLKMALPFWTGSLWKSSRVAGGVKRHRVNTGKHGACVCGREGIVVESVSTASSAKGKRGEVRDGGAGAG